MMSTTITWMREQQDLARVEQRAAERRAEASVKALTEVKAALNFPVDIVTRSLLFTNFLEKEGKINRP